MTQSYIASIVYPRPVLGFPGRVRGRTSLSFIILSSLLIIIAKSWQSLQSSIIFAIFPDFNSFCYCHRYDMVCSLWLFNRKILLVFRNYEIMLPRAWLVKRFGTFWPNSQFIVFKFRFNQCCQVSWVTV